MLLLALFAAGARADVRPAAAFEAANKLYEEGRFADAAAAYQKLAPPGRTSAATCVSTSATPASRPRPAWQGLAAYRQAELLTARSTCGPISSSRAAGYPHAHARPPAALAGS